MRYKYMGRENVSWLIVNTMGIFSFTAINIAKIYVDIHKIL